MQKLLSYFLIILAIMVAWACGSDNNSTVDENVTFPKELLAPEGARFSYLLFENDFNAVPKDGNPANYSNEYKKSETSGMSFGLTNKKEFGPGLFSVVTPKKGQWNKVSFSCFKPSKVVTDPANTKGFAVISYQRGDSTLYYNSYPIKELLDAQNKQFIDKWEELTVWHKIPEDLQPGDRQKIYQWNPKGGVIYFDDFVVEVWTTEPEVPNGVSLSHGIAEQNYETDEYPQIKTKETAVRGVQSCVLSGKDGSTKFGPGYTGTLAEANLQPGDFVKVSFSALKKHKLRVYMNSASMVVSLLRDGKQLLWEGMHIDPKIQQNGKQVMGTWVKMAMWQQIPADAQPTDMLKIYPWNTQPTPIYIDDLLVEVWKKGAAAPEATEEAVN